MKKNNLKYKILAILVATAIIFLSIAVIIYSNKELLKWQEELAKALMGLAMTAIIGGFIKFLFDLYKEEEEQINKDKEAEDEKKLRKKEFSLDLLNHLRKAFDAVDGARLLIEAHKSAKTYGEKMRENIIPVIVSLYDIKRSLVDSVEMIEDAKRLKSLRINIHYMIAYLQALADEYKEKYPVLSNLQYYEEEWKRKARDYFIQQHMKNQDDKINAVKEKIPGTPVLTWGEISRLPIMGKFLQDNYASPYRKMFVDFYEWSKKILKNKDVKKKPEWYDEKYIHELDLIDIKKENDTMTEDDSLVRLLINDKLKAGDS